jgi:hypothetical protein
VDAKGGNIEVAERADRRGLIFLGVGYFVAAAVLLILSLA